MNTSVLTPIMIATGISIFADFQAHPTDVSGMLKRAVAGCIAGLLSDGISQIPGMAPVMTAIGWLAVVGVFLNGNPSPATTLSNVVKGVSLWMTSREFCWLLSESRWPRLLW